jgi:hypothetical protein
MIKNKYGSSFHISGAMYRTEPAIQNDDAVNSVFFVTLEIPKSPG